MLIGYARISTQDQDLSLQTAALEKAGCEKIFTDKSQRAKSDKSLWGAKSFNKEELDKIIKNTYKTLMTRGQKGCYIYCEDKQLQEHIKRILKTKK